MFGKLCLDLVSFVLCLLRYGAHTGFPCSVVSSRANSSLCAKSAAANCLIFSLRNSTDVFLQPWNEIRAAFTASSTSAEVDTGEGNKASKVEGFTPCRVATVDLTWPLMILEKVLKLIFSASQVAAIVLDFDQIGRCGELINCIHILYMGFESIYICIVIP